MKSLPNPVVRPFSGPWLLAILLAVSLTAGAATPEYLTDEAPAPESLQEEVSPFEDLWILPRLQEAGPLKRLLEDQFPGLHGMIQGAQLHVEPRLYARYRDEDNGGTKREAIAGGGAVKLISGWWDEKIRLGVTGYTSQKLSGPSDRGGTGLLRDPQSGYTALGEAYLEAKMGTFGTKLFRQELDLPYLNRNDSRMTPKTFEGYLASWKPFDALTIGGGHVTKMKDRTASRFVPMAEAAGVDDESDGLTTLGFRWDMKDDFSFGGINHYGWNTFNTFYTELRLVDSFGASDLSWKTALQFTDQRSVGDELLGDFDIQTFGGQVALGWNSLIASAAVTHTTGGDGLRKPFGGTPGFTSLMVSDFDRPEETAVRLGLSYSFADIGIEGLSAFANYAHGDVPNHGKYAADDQDEWNITVDYRPETTVFKNLWFRFRTGWNHRGNQQREEYRFIVNYSVNF